MAAAMVDAAAGDGGGDGKGVTGVRELKKEEKGESGSIRYFG